MAEVADAVQIVPSKGDPDGSKFKAYQTMYNYSIHQPEEFWSKEAIERLSWIRPFDTVKNGTLEEGNMAWFTGGQLNACYQCCDRHDPNKPAIIWEGNENDESKVITYGEMTKRVCQFANVLKAKGVKKGDRVIIYMPMVPETAFSMLACARIGAVHSVVFAGFSAESLAARIEDAEAKVIMTADFGLRASKEIPLKKVVDDAIKLSPYKVECCLCYKRINPDCPIKPREAKPVAWTEGFDFWLDEEADKQRPYCPCEPMDSEDVLFLLYTSGSTGKPKGIMHTTAGYMLMTNMTFEKTFGYESGDVYACVADVGWITGHSYIVYGPLGFGGITVMFESLPTYPHNGRYWDMVQKHKINIFYTAPTAIRALMKFGDEPVLQFDRSSLKTLGTVGEPINPEAWNWYYKVVGEARCDIVDTYWQTETGAHVVTPLSGVTPMKPGSATFPFFGVELAIVKPTTAEPGSDESPPVEILEGNNVQGILAIKTHWPSMVRTVYGDHQRFMNTYLKAYPGFYFAGDGSYRDKDGYYWITGRVDDVLNVSGHRLGTAEIESALVSHEDCAEAAVIGVPHDVKGEGIFAYVMLNKAAEGKDSAEMVKSLRLQVRKVIGPIATPDAIVIVPGLPKTRSGKIMRRVLRKVAAKETDSLGDTSTLADPSVVDTLIKLVAEATA